MAGTVIVGSALAAGEAATEARHAYIYKGALDAVPLLAMLLLTLVLVIGSVWLGMLLGRKRPQGKEGPLGAVVAATLGLLAFMLAFTFGIAADRYNARRLVLLDEVESVGTTYLRAGLLPQPQRDKIRGRLREYVDVRLQAATEPGRLSAGLRRSEELHDEMWQEAEALVAAGHNSETDALFVDSLNKTIDLHNRRAATSLLYRVPTLVWYMLLGVTAVAMMMVGYLFGVSGSKNWILVVALGVLFSAVITFTFDLDRPGEGLVRTSQLPMKELQRSMRASQPASSSGPALKE